MEYNLIQNIPEMAHILLLKKISNIYSSDHLYVAFYLEKCSLTKAVQLL